jgi:putative ABC transport system permease protein
VVLLILGLAGAVLMVGGTLTATFLALSDARPDLATLAAVGAPPLVRRRVGAAYAGFVGLVGAALGVLVGLASRSRLPMVARLP